MFIPIHDNILVYRDEKETEKNGIILVTEDNKPQTGVVKAVGRGRLKDGELVVPNIKAGDHVLFGSWSGTEIKIDDGTFIILTPSEIYGKFIL